MIAGFELPTAGAVLLQGQDVTHTPPYDRDLNTVFQDYALFPHLTVQQNVEYGLKVKGVKRAERRRRAGQMLESVRLAQYGDRKPDQLSGGQRQRVALARALVNHPKVLLLDEPLGALDLKLREEMQVELKNIQAEVGITFVFVTHDQGEALSMSSRIAVFNNGRIEQVGVPRDIYESPTDHVRRDVRRDVERAVDASSRGGCSASTRAHSLRPERIRVDGGPAAADEVSIAGTCTTSSTSAPTAGSASASTTAASSRRACRATPPPPWRRAIAARLSFPRAAAFVVANTGTALDEAGGDLPALDMASVAANA